MSTTSDLERIGQIAINVKSLDRAVAFEAEPHLVARLPQHDLHLAFFRDTEGNFLGLMCERARA